SATFRVGDRVPELWWPETGRIERAPVFRQADGMTTVALQFPPAGSVFVVFREQSASDPIVSLKHEGKAILDAGGAPTSLRPIGIRVDRARDGGLSDPARTRDVRE